MANFKTGSSEFRSMNKKILIIDTTDRGKIKVGVRIDSKTTFISSSATILKSQATLPLIEKILEKEKIGLKDLDEIEVNTGPGSFTGIRVGISIGNALSYLLKIPINGKNIGQLAEPVYN